ncbi:DUF167 domain-containing protein [Planctomycetota bacterium]
MKNMTNLSIQESDEGVVLVAKIVPGSTGSTRICGLLDGMLKVKVAAPPEKGKANQCLLRFLAKELGLKKNAVSILSGKTCPVKQVRILGISAETLLKKLHMTEQDVRE